MNLINTMTNSVYVRRRELGMMQALGMSRKNSCHGCSGWRDCSIRLAPSLFPQPLEACLVMCFTLKQRIQVF